MFLSSKLFRRFYPQSMFSPSAHISILSSLILSAERAFSKTTLQKLSWWQSDCYLSQNLYSLAYQPSCFSLNLPQPLLLPHLSATPFPPASWQAGAPSPFHATHFLWENVNDYRLMNLNIHLQLILIRPLSWDADPSTQRPKSISTWRPTATSNQWTPDSMSSLQYFPTHLVIITKACQVLCFNISCLCLHCTIAALTWGLPSTAGLLWSANQPKSYMK